MVTTAFIEQLKNAGEDYEFYPTTKEMIKAIWMYHKNRCMDKAFSDVLDIGCGSCNFKRFVDEFNTSMGTRLGISNYYVIEKSLILLEGLDASTIVLGTDFRETTLIDKEVDTIFCNPPYSEYEEWTAKIINESKCKWIYLIIPQRWNKSEKILKALYRLGVDPEEEKKLPEKERKIAVIGRFDFLSKAERKARAKVDIVFIHKEYTFKESGFDNFFDDIFGMPETGGDNYNFEYEEKRAASQELKAELLTGKNKVELLCNGYEAKQKQLFEYFKTICNLDVGILKAIGVHKNAVKSALKKNFTGLKNLYWETAFDCLEEITSRLTSESRRELLHRFTLLKTVEFTPSNIYSLIIWIIKNTNKYAEEQMIKFFMAISSPENIKNYKSNQKVFEQDNWRYKKGSFTHYTLDYRIICTTYALPGQSGYTYNFDQGLFKYKVENICTIAGNIGFNVAGIDLPACYGAKGVVFFSTGKSKLETLFEFRVYKNNNVHIKFNIEFMKALNVIVAQKLGWIKQPEDIAREFTAEMAQGAGKYFNTFKSIALETGCALLLSTKATDGHTPPKKQLHKEANTSEFIDGK